MNDLKPIFADVDSSRPLLIAGPCSAETEEQVLTTAHALAREGVQIFRAGVWKPRTKPGGFEGVGEPGLAWLRRVKAETGMYTATEVATRAHVEAALRYEVDLLWIGALERIYNAGIRRLGAVHRGFTWVDRSIYRNYPFWTIPIELRRRIPGLPLFCDPSHIGGKRELIAPLAQQAMDLGFEGLLVEAHCSPDEAWSDKAQQVEPQLLAFILRNLIIRDMNTTTDNLNELRRQIDKLDDELIDLLARRMKVSGEIGRYKKEHNLSVLQSQRYEEILARRARQAVELGMDREFMRSVMQAIHEESIRQQMKVIE